MAEAERQFEQLTRESRISELSSRLERRDLEPLAVLSEEAWRSEAERGGQGATGSPAALVDSLALFTRF